MSGRNLTNLGQLALSNEVAQGAGKYLRRQ